MLRAPSPGRGRHSQTEGHSCQPVMKSVLQWQQGALSVGEHGAHTAESQLDGSSHPSSGTTTRPPYTDFLPLPPPGPGDATACFSLTQPNSAFTGGVALACPRPGRPWVLHCPFAWSPSARLPSVEDSAGCFLQQSGDVSHGNVLPILCRVVGSGCAQAL